MCSSSCGILVLIAIHVLLVWRIFYFIFFKFFYFIMFFFCLKKFLKTIATVADIFSGLFKGLSCGFYMIKQYIWKHFVGNFFSECYAFHQKIECNSKPKKKNKKRIPSISFNSGSGKKPLFETNKLTSFVVEIWICFLFLFVC